MLFSPPPSSRPTFRGPYIVAHVTSNNLVCRPNPPFAVRKEIAPGNPAIEEALLDCRSSSSPTGLHLFVVPEDSAFVDDARKPSAQVGSIRTSHIEPKQSAGENPGSSFADGLEHLREIPTSDGSDVRTEIPVIGGPVRSWAVPGSTGEELPYFSGSR